MFNLSASTAVRASSRPVRRLAKTWVEGVPNLAYFLRKEVGINGFNAEGTLLVKRLQDNEAVRPSHSVARWINRHVGLQHVFDHIQSILRWRDARRRRVNHQRLGRTEPAVGGLV